LLIFLLIGLTLFAPIESDLIAQQLGVPIDRLLIIDQNVDPEYKARACGPTAILNSLRFATGDERDIFPGLVGSDDATRLRYLIDRWFTGRASVVADGVKRFGAHGCYVEDLAAGFNELLREYKQPVAKSGFLDRRPEEGSDRNFLERIHGQLADSLRSGLPPVVSLRSFVARKHYGESDTSRWGIARHHFVVITGVPEKLAENDLGFRFEYIDPNGGETGSAYTYAEQHLAYRAFKGSNGIGEWLRGTPFLLVIAPGIKSLQPLNADWPDRVIITLNHAIYR